MAAAYSLPEFDHNQVEAAAAARGDIGTFRFVILDAPIAHPRVRLRVRETAAMLSAAGHDVRVVDAGGETVLEAILAASSLGTWTSYYLSLLRGVEPTPVPVMEALKVRLAGAE
jgi:glucose/mannose-6-phosphate isomerase